MDEFEYTISFKVPENRLIEVVNELKNRIIESSEKKLRGGVEVKSIQITSAGADGAWKYFLTYYPKSKNITVTVKRFENQPTSYSILKITDKIIEAEDFKDFVERIAKIYLTLKLLRKELIGKEEVSKEGIEGFF